MSNLLNYVTIYKQTKSTLLKVVAPFLVLPCPAEHLVCLYMMVAGMIRVSYTLSAKSMQHSRPNQCAVDYMP